MRSLVICLSLSLLGGCANGIIPGFSQAEAVSVIGTKKTITDNIYSFYYGKNCSSLRTNRGLTYCEEDEVLPKAEIYCYKTLGRVTCYDRPDPYRSQGTHQKVGENDHNYVTKQ